MGSSLSCSCAATPASSTPWPNLSAKRSPKLYEVREHAPDRPLADHQTRRGSTKHLGGFRPFFEASSTPHPPLRDVRLLPALRVLLAHDPADKDALAAYLDLAPGDAGPYVVGAVCAADGPPLIDTFDKVRKDRLSQVDACLLPLLQGQTASLKTGAAVARSKNTGRANFIWKQRVTMAARFGSPKLLPAIESSGAQQLAANPNDTCHYEMLLGLHSQRRVPQP
jgi:hypothetical protein